VADGRIKLKSGVDVTAIRPDLVLLSDGTELPADLIVYATGYGAMNGWVARIISQEVADKVGKCWGLGSDTTKDPGPCEGEQGNRRIGTWPRLRGEPRGSGHVRRTRRGVRDRPYPRGAVGGGSQAGHRHPERGGDVQRWHLPGRSRLREEAGVGRLPVQPAG